MHANAGGPNHRLLDFVSTTPGRVPWRGRIPAVEVRPTGCLDLARRHEQRAGTLATVRTWGSGWRRSNERTLQTSQ